MWEQLCLQTGHNAHVWTLTPSRNNNDLATTTTCQPQQGPVSHNNDLSATTRTCQPQQRLVSYKNDLSATTTTCQPQQGPVSHNKDLSATKTTCQPQQRHVSHNNDLSATTKTCQLPKRPVSHNNDMSATTTTCQPQQQWSAILLNTDQMRSNYLNDAHLICYNSSTMLKTLRKLLLQNNSRRASRKRLMRCTAICINLQL